MWIVFGAFIFITNKMRDFVKPDTTVMQRVVKLSLLLRSTRISLLQLRHTMLCIRGLSFSIPSYNDLCNVESELMYRELEIHNACRLLLEPIFMGIDFGHRKLGHWAVSIHDIKYGYSELEEILQYGIDNKPIRFGRKFILLFEDFEDKETLGKFYSGELISMNVAQHFIATIPKKEDKINGLYDAVVKNFELAARYRQSNLK